MHKPLSKYILSTFIITVLAVRPLTGSRVFASADFCNPAEKVFKSTGAILPKDVRNTNVNVGASTMVDTGFIVTTGTEWGDYMGCADYVADLVDVPKVKSALQDGECLPSEDETCESITNQFKTNEYYENAGGGDNRSHVQGGFLGLAYRIERAVTKEPIPVNMAYFFNDYAKRLPIVGEKAMAADYVDYRHTLISSILAIWKMFAAVAYGIMSLILIYVGITIIMRKQVNQKVVVTVQYSLPKVLLALILIAFSYPIGATITSLSWSLWNSAPTIWINLNELMGGPDYFGSILQLSLGGLLLIAVAAFASLTPLALGITLLMTLVTIVLVVLYLWALVKALYIYIKMLIAIITAPLVFAMGAIPGNEDKTMEWFKRMLAYGLSIFAIHSVIFLTQVVTFSVVSETFSESIFAGSLMAIFGSSFLLIFGFAFAAQVPSHVENAIMGKPSGRR